MSKDIEDELPDPPVIESAVTKVEAPDLPEAGGIAWIDLFGVRYVTDEDGKTYRKVFKISVTSRARTPIEAIDGLKTAIDYAAEKYKLFPYQ